MKAILLEIGDPETQTIFVYYEAGLPYIQVTQLGEFSSFDFGTSDYNTDSKDIVSVTLTDNSIPTTLLATNSIAEVRAQDSSFHFDVATQTVYLHLPDYRVWWTYDVIELGYVEGYSNGGYHSGITYYPPRLVTDGMAVEYEKDPLYAGLLEFKEYTFTLRNGDHELDNLASQDLYGNAARVKVGAEDDAYADFKTVFDGRVSSIPEIRFDEVTIDAQDKRKFLSRAIPTNQYNQTDYPSLPDKYVGKNIPIAFGDLRNISLTPIETYKFKICDPLEGEYDGITSVDSVYVDGVAVTPTATDLTNCTVTIDSADADREFSRKVTADITGYDDGALVANGLKVLRELLRIYGGVQYIDSLYNTTQWDSYETAAADIAMFVEEEDLIDVVEQISLSLFGIFYVEPDGRYSFKKTENTRAIADTIGEDDIISEPYAEYDEESFLSSVRIDYNKDWDEDDYQRLVYDDDEAEIFLKYRQYRDKVYETFLVSATDAESMAVEVMAISADIPTYFPVKVPYETYKDLEILDNVNTSIKRVVLVDRDKIEVVGYLTTEGGDILTTEGGERLFVSALTTEKVHEKQDWYGDVKTEIIRQFFNFDDETIDLRLRLIKEL